MRAKWVVVVGESDCWDDGVSRVAGPFCTEAEAQSYAEHVDARLVAEVFELGGVIDADE